MESLLRQRIGPLKQLPRFNSNSAANILPIREHNPSHTRIDSSEPSFFRSIAPGRAQVDPCPTVHGRDARHTGCRHWREYCRLRDRSRRPPGPASFSTAARRDLGLGEPNCITCRLPFLPTLIGRSLLRVLTSLPSVRFSWVLKLHFLGAAPH